MENPNSEEPPLKKKKNIKCSYDENGTKENSKAAKNGSLRNIKVGSRKSQLALFQSNFVVDLLKKNHINISYDIVTMTTTGDKILDVALSKIGEKSLFTKELEIALEKNEVHVVVHSLKDLPTTLPPGMVIGAICKRENPFDVVVFKMNSKYKDLTELPCGSVIGTSSLRRIAQLKKLYPSLIFESVRGNLNTRLRKLDEENTYSALILAAAGLIRLDLEHRIGKTLSPKECMYAVGQGALAIECRDNDSSIISLLSKISDKDTTLCCIAERAFMKTLEGGCSVPVAVDSKIINGRLFLKGGVFSLDGSESIVEESSIDMNLEVNENIYQKHYVGVVAPHISNILLNSAQKLGEALAKLLLKKGAASILEQARTKQ